VLENCSDEGRRLGRATGQGEDPCLDKQQASVLAPALCRYSLKPTEDGRVAARVRVGDPSGRDHVCSLVEQTALERVLDRPVDGPELPVSSRCPPMERCHEIRVTVLELDAQQLHEELVEPIPPSVPAPLDADQEQIGARQLGERLSAVLLFEKRVAQRAAELVEDRHPEHELLRRRVVRVEDLLDEQVDNVPGRLSRSA
jgi:hypothetical protein